MARTWLSVTVELLGGAGCDPWPWPGRIFAVGPSHTFNALAEAINDGFARWDRSHLSMFTLADGRIVTDLDTGGEMITSPGGPLPAVLDIDTARVAKTVEPGAEFQFTYDLGDNWVHRCTVAEAKVDPIEVLGIRPDAPLPYWGWGTIPDQYGRRWNDDDGESRMPRRPARPHPMLMHAWPRQDEVPDLDITELRQAIAARDRDRFLAAITGCDINDALQQVAAGIPMAVAEQASGADDVALSIVNRLTFRGWPGDHILADDVLALLRHEPLPGRPLPIDLDMFTALLETTGSFEQPGCYLDVSDGQTYPASFTDAGLVGGAEAIDVEADPDRWVYFAPRSSRDSWQDMADFAECQPTHLREKIGQAIEGKGAFRRFRDVVDEESLVDAWHRFSDDRQRGRARELLAEHGIRVMAR